VRVAFATVPALTLRRAGTDSDRALLLELCIVPRTPAKPKPIAAVWQISRIAKKAINLGQVEAADAETAIKRAIEKYDIAVEHRDRLAARPIMRASQP
jgi:hypothetical protein